MTEAKILLCERCNATLAGIELDDSTRRVITVIETADELDGNAVVSGSNGGGGNDRRLKRGTEAASLAGNETVVSLPGEMIRINPLEPSKPTPIKRDADDGDDIGGGPTDMTQAIMEQRADYDADDEFQAANGHGYDALRTKPVVNRHRDYDQTSRYADESDEQHLEDAEEESDDDGGGSSSGDDHNSHYEYVPMEFDSEGNHRYYPFLLPVPHPS